jgi:MFS transporter, CP family, cyanate transporter
VRPLPGRTALLRLVILWLAGADLRLTMLAVPPVLPLIHRDLGLSEKAIGLLSGLPILLLGLAAIPGSLLIARIGARRAAITGLLFVAATAAARGLGPSWPMLLAMTVLMGAGIAVIQPALPTLVAEWFHAMPAFATAVYANGLLVGEAVPAALTIPLVLPLVGGGWPASFAAWSLPLVATALMVLLLTPHGAPPLAGRPARWWPDWKSPLVWQLGILMGGTGGLYFSANAFIPDYLHAIGRPQLVALCLAALNSAQLPASVLMLFVSRRLGRSRVPFVVMPLLAVAGIAGLLARADWAIVLGAGAMGFFGAFVLILTLALPPVLAPFRDVPRLSAGMFAVGYGLTCTIPLIGGAIWDATGIPAGAFLAGALSAAAVAAVALTLDPRPSGR